MRAPFRSNLLIALLVLFTATGVRFAWVAHAIGFASGFSSQSSFDDEEMGNIATNLAQGRGFSSPFGMGSQPTAWECPLVPSVYAAVIRLEGGPTGTAARAVAWLQAVVGGFAACLQWLIVAHIMDRHPAIFPRWLSPAVAIMVCLWPESVASVANRWYYVWQDAALALFVLLAMRWWEQLSSKRGIITGVSGGMLALINVTPIPIVLGAMVIPVFKFRRQKRVWQSAAIAACCFGAVLAPWAVRNTLVFHTPVALRSNAGFELFQGNNAIECIRQPDNTPHPAVNQAEFQLYTRMGEVQYSRYSFNRAIAFIRSHPALTARRIGDRIYVSWLTDLTDHWISPAQRPWWSVSRPGMARFILSDALIVASFATLVWGVITGKFRRLPHAPLFTLLFVFLPLPHYFTLADPEYMTTLRLWVGIIAVCIIALRRSAVLNPSENGQLPASR